VFFFFFLTRVILRDLLVCRLENIQCPHIAVNLKYGIIREKGSFDKLRVGFFLGILLT